MSRATNRPLTKYLVPIVRLLLPIVVGTGLIAGAVALDVAAPPVRAESLESVGTRITQLSGSECHVLQTATVVEPSDGDQSVDRTVAEGWLRPGLWAGDASALASNTSSTVHFVSPSETWLIQQTLGEVTASHYRSVPAGDGWQPLWMYDSALSAVDESYCHD